MINSLFIRQRTIRQQWWQAEQPAAEYVTTGGLVRAAFQANVTSSGGTAGRTFINDSPAHRIRQDGPVKRVIVEVAQASGASGWKVVAFRPNGQSFDFVGQSERFTPLGSGVKVIDLAQPINCQIGDCLGVWMAAGNRIADTEGGTCRYAAGDVQGLDSFANTGGVTLNIEAQGEPPFLGVTGDSIAEGHNGASHWHGIMHQGVSGTPSSEIANQLRAIVGNGAELTYQNFAHGGETFDWVAAVGIPACVATRARAILVHCGVNDVGYGRTWAQIEANLNSIAAQLLPGQRLFLDEILPWTAGTDAQAATIRTYNANLWSWGLSKGARVIKCHGAMGQIRPSTGQLDDLRTEYNQDGVHLAQMGVDRMAELCKADLIGMYGMA